MAVYVAELFESRLQTIADNKAERSTATFLFVAVGYSDEPSAISAVIAFAGPSYGTMRYHSTELTEQINNNPMTWKCRVKYLDIPAVITTYDSSGGTAHIQQSIATVSKYANAGDTPPDFKGAILFDGQNVAGVDVTVAAFVWTETHYMLTADMNILVPNFYSQTGTVNNDTFRGNPPGSCLFYGVTAQEKEDGLWEVQFKFGFQINTTTAMVGSIGPITKAGYDLLWIYYTQNIDQTQLVKQPYACYVEQVYPRSAFVTLGI